MIAILQPHIPHYREKFFSLLAQHQATDVFCYDLEESQRMNFNKASIPITSIANYQKGPLLFYNPFALLKRKYNVLVLMLHFGHLTTWLLLLTKFIHRKKIILWGQGISVKRYLQEEQHPDWKLKLMVRMADAVWIYTEKDATMWQKVFPKKAIVGLNNTLECKGQSDKSRVAEYKKKYGITQKHILIFSARFENPYRRTDLLEEVIKRLDSEKYGFIIIGSGRLKPDFSKYSNVYDFGKMYDEDIKQELFSIADIYFQPGWVGLSVVEAMAYSLPIFSFRRTEDIKQCVEYAYIQEDENGYLFDSLGACLQTIQTISDEELNRMGTNAYSMVQYKLTLENMVSKAESVL